MPIWTGCSADPHATGTTMRNALQEQLLKAGLAKKSKLDQIAREQVKARQGKAPRPADAEAVDVERQRQEKAERDRALAAERNAQARQAELRAQARQIIEQSRVQCRGEIDYRFTDGTVIRSVLVDAATRTQLAKGALVIVRQDEAYALLPRAAADKVIERVPELVVLDHAGSASAQVEGEDDPYYSQFKVPDDLVW
jgi:uncharacterized protein YaiL (DUF2058 family)